MDITYGSWCANKLPNPYSGTEHDEPHGTRRPAKNWNQPPTNKTTRQGETETTCAPRGSHVGPRQQFRA